MSEMNGIPQDPSQQPQDAASAQQPVQPEPQVSAEAVVSAEVVEVVETVESVPVAEVIEVVEAAPAAPAVAEPVQPVQPVSAPAPAVAPVAAAPVVAVQPQHEAPQGGYPMHAAPSQAAAQPLHGSHVAVPANPPVGAPVPPAPQPQAPAGQPYNYATPADQRAAQQSAQGSKPSSNKSAGKTFAMGFAGAALACCLGLGAFGIWESTNAQPANATHSDSQSGVTLGATTDKEIVVDSDDITLPEVVADKCLPSVVAIDVYTDASAAYGYGYGVSQNYGSQLQQSSLGSGVVLSADGYIVTNNHVVEGADALKVTIEGQEYDAEIVGTDPSSDLAVIKAKDASGLTVMELGDSDDLVIGEWVMTLGSPFGFEQSVATGIVSATSRSQTMSASTDMFGNATGETTVYANLIQTDAAINPGNSGGALVNAEGKLIGINTLITSYSGNYSGVGFAIPVNYAVNIAQQIIDGKTPTHAQLGVSLSTVTPEIAQRYGFAADSGAYIAAVNPDSAAAEAGIVAGDIVTGFDGKTVASADDLMLDVRGKNPGDAVTLTVVKSDGSTSDVSVTLGSDEASQLAAQQQREELEQQQQQGQGEQYGYGQGGRGGSLLDELFGGR